MMRFADQTPHNVSCLSLGAARYASDVSHGFLDKVPHVVSVICRMTQHTNETDVFPSTLCRTLHFSMIQSAQVDGLLGLASREVRHKTTRRGGSGSYRYSNHLSRQADAKRSVVDA